MIQNAHVFAVDKNTFTVHSKFGFCGIVNPQDAGQQTKRKQNQ